MDSEVRICCYSISFSGLLLKVATGNFFLPFVGMLQEYVLRFLMFSQGNQYLYCVRYSLKKLKWLTVIFVLIFVIWLAVSRRYFCCVTESKIKNCYFLSLWFTAESGRHLYSKSWRAVHVFHWQALCSLPLIPVSSLADEHVLVLVVW